MYISNDNKVKYTNKNDSLRCFLYFIIIVFTLISYYLKERGRGLELVLNEFQ